jgi:hypothetical protein
MEGQDRYSASGKIILKELNHDRLGDLLEFIYEAAVLGFAYNLIEQRNTRRLLQAADGYAMQRCLRQTQYWC